ncbi:fatty acyl-AMP ligase [Nocardia donostiensis]|uniref:fatty acyl-AMP ligase n=1 Tax=Nocardia donostiensis TaxID=1538463 RepID=UPI0020CA8E0F|nr:fatty acyl-AMP ligase [Nocardia donostiensis]
MTLRSAPAEDNTDPAADIDAHARGDPLVARLRQQARLRGDATAFVELRYQGQRCLPESMTYAELDRVAATFAAQLQTVSRPGDRVAILCGHGLGYIVAFLSCLYARRTAVPLFPAADRNRSRLETVLDDARPSVAFVSADDSTSPRLLAPVFDQFLPVDRHAPDIGPLVAPDETAGTGPAYLQYTSGSTRSPAGVRVTCRNLATALRQLCTALPAARAAPIVTWLPFFHDMGLLLGLALPLYTGVPGVTMAPVDFVKRPIRWLRACSDYRAGMTGSPNFGVALAVSATTADERTGLDLSALEVVLNGAEPVRAATLDAFTSVFADYGFRHRAHTPGYGLAEATLPVAISKQAEEPVITRFDRDALAAGYAVQTKSGAGFALVACGMPMVDEQVAVVDPGASLELEPGMVGEIWVCGANVCDGYHSRPDCSAIFATPLPGRTGSWLRTGDLGFWFHGRLYVTDRLKDVIVIDGRNHYPADIEATVIGCAPEVRPDRVTVFGYDDGATENVVVVAELAQETIGEPREIERRIAAAVASTHDIRLADIVLTVRGRIPRTSSGKLRRGECRARYLHGTL